METIGITHLHSKMRINAEKVTQSMRKTTWRPKTFFAFLLLLLAWP